MKVNQKAIRAVVIRDYMQAAGYSRAICFTCGNAARELRNVGVDVLEVSPHGGLQANRWFEPHEIARVWPGFFDATSGHLPAHLMVKIAEALRAELGQLSAGPHGVPTGSGETITCLRWAYPGVIFIPTQDGTDATTISAQGALTPLIDLLTEWHKTIEERA